MKHIKVSYTTVTPESAEQGDFAETGWENEEGIDCTPNGWDYLEDGISTPTKKAIDILKNEYAIYPSSSHFHSGLWYTAPAIEDRDYFEKGIEKQLSFHLHEFTEAEEEEVFKTLKAEKFFV